MFVFNDLAHSLCRTHVINGVFISKKIVEVVRRDSATKTGQASPGVLEANAEPRFLHSADTTEFVSQNYSVTEDPTRHLTGSQRKQ
jgi:hypothetical protein